jgi:hypothetical protein
MMTLYNDVLIELQDYILDDKNMKHSLQMRIERPINEKQNVVKKVLEIKKQELFNPNQQDSLFWIYYILKNGLDKYEMLNHKNSLMAKQLKIELVSIIRQNKDIAKIYKFDTLTNLESNLANDNNLSVKTFLTLCAIENINVIFTSKKTYFELMMNDSNDIFIVEEINNQSKYNSKFGYKMATDSMLEIIKSTLYKISNIDKPIKALSVYKVGDLIDICNKLSIDTTNKDTGKHKSKKDLYEAIIQYF